MAGIGHPVPVENALATDGHIVAPGLDLLEEELEVVAANVHVEEDSPGGVHDTDVHLGGMKVDAAVVLCCRSMESHLFLGMMFWLLESSIGGAHSALPLSGTIKPQNEGLDELQDVDPNA